MFQQKIKLREFVAFSKWDFDVLNWEGSVKWIH